MILSKYNIISAIADSEDYFIVNLLSQEADILTYEDYKNIISGTYPYTNELVKKGYLVDPVQEEKLYKQKYLKFLDKRDSDEIQIFYVPAYTCNFACLYCYQDQYEVKSNHTGKEVIQSFYNYIDRQFADRRKYITVFGGEPLMDSTWHRENLSFLLDEAAIRGLDVAVVTNGYYLLSYIDILKKAAISEIQVTLDGMETMHDKRRPLKNGKGTFKKIVKGIDMCLKQGFPVNLRMVLDKENISELPKLARFAIEKQWTASTLFKSQIGRNYELHHCQSDSAQLYNRIDLYKDIYQLIRKYPEILEFHKPAFSVARFLFDEGTLPDPLFDSCPATKTEWAFDYTGKIYSCTATVGKTGEELGMFYPRVSLNEEQIAEWESRDVLAIPECKDCNLQLACGGGCGSVAKNSSGKICSPDCRPVKELMEMGISAYFSNI